jgi:hypothetical protein
MKARMMVLALVLVCAAQAADVGVESVVWPYGDSVPPGDSLPTAIIHNFGDSVVVAPVTFEFYNEAYVLIYSDLTNVELPARETAAAVFQRFRLSYPGTRYGCVTTCLAGDTNPANDTFFYQFTVTGPGDDVGMYAILAPLGDIDTLPVTPASVVRNYGGQEASPEVTFAITFEREYVYLESAQVANLTPGSARTVEFPVWTGHREPGYYTAECYTALTGDGNRANDTIHVTFRVVASGICANGGPAADRLPVFPTIARGVLNQPASSGANLLIPCWLLDAGGRRLLVLHPGENDVSRLAPGVYFVQEQPRLKRQAQAVRKIVIQH